MNPRANALRAVCGLATVQGTCPGSVARLTIHVGVCDTCAAIWWVERKTRYVKAAGEAYPPGSPGYRALAELIDVLGEKQDELAEVWAALDKARAQKGAA